MSGSDDMTVTMLIVATRTDGLGGRLLAMANAKSLADRLGYRFGFTWNGGAIQRQDIPHRRRGREDFCRRFIDKHWLGEKIETAGFGVLDDSRFHADPS